MSATLLALDWSSPVLSVALSTDGAPRRREETVERFDAPTALRLVEGLLEEAQTGLADVAEIRIGVGPGNFSGIRLALAWAFGAAAPGGTRVRAYSSLDLLTARLLADGHTDFHILGDARRGHWWGREVSATRPGPLERLTPEVWESRLDGRPRFSPEAARLPERLGFQSSTPAAADLLQLSLVEVETAPVYLHGAVAD